MSEKLPIRLEASPDCLQDPNEILPAGIGRLYGSWSLRRVAPNFDAHLVAGVNGGLQIVDCVADPCAAMRTRAHIKRDDQQLFTMQLLLAGRENFRIGDNKVVLSPGDILLWNSTRPAEFDVVERIRKISVTMPLARLRSWMPNRWQTLGGRLAADAEGTELLASFIRLVAPAHIEGALPNGGALIEAFLGLLVNVTEGNLLPSNPKTSQLLSVKRYIEANLADPSLSLASICAANRISVRYLHALFEEEGTTVQRYIYHARLLRCARELENPAMAGRPVTDIAFSWGFQNASHFSRRFKDEFGLSPKDFRKTALAASRPCLADGRP